jgi:hypothetical protein
MFKIALIFVSLASTYAAQPVALTEAALIASAPKCSDVRLAFQLEETQFGESPEGCCGNPDRPFVSQRPLFSGAVTQNCHFPFNQTVLGASLTDTVPMQLLTGIAGATGLPVNVSGFRGIDFVNAFTSPQGVAANNAWTTGSPQMRAIMTTFIEGLVYPPTPTDCTCDLCPEQCFPTMLLLVESFPSLTAYQEFSAAQEVAFTMFVDYVITGGKVFLLAEAGDIDAALTAAPFPPSLTNIAKVPVTTIANVAPSLR